MKKYEDPCPECDAKTKCNIWCNLKIDYENVIKPLMEEIKLGQPQIIPPTTPLAIPYRCPVCGGNGLVCNGFYSTTTGYIQSTSTAAEKCRTCGGSGIVWGPGQ
jgi:rubrerythrin